MPSNFSFHAHTVPSSTLITLISSLTHKSYHQINSRLDIITFSSLQLMASYQNILREFQKQGLQEQTIITKHEVKKALDNISAQNSGVYEFNPEVANQIWEETEEKNSGGPLKLRDFIVTMVQAQNILRDHVNKAQSQIRMQTDEFKKKQLLNDLYSYTQDHRTLTSPFGLQQIRESKQIEQSKIAIFSTEMDERQESTDLKVVYIVNTILFFLQMLLMFHKHHFFTIICTLLVFSAFILNYFDRSYVKFVLISLAYSALLDLVWIFVLAGDYWNPNAQTQHSTIHTGFLRLIVFMVCVELLLKLIIAGLLLKYRTIGDHVKKKASLCGQTYLLEGRRNPNNLATAVLPQSLAN